MSTWVSGGQCFSVAGHDNEWFELEPALEHGRGEENQTEREQCQRAGHEVRVSVKCVCVSGLYFGSSNYPERSGLLNSEILRASYHLLLGNDQI